MGTTRRRWIAALAALACALTTPALTGASRAGADDSTAAYDLLRTGWDASEPGLDPATVTGANFGELFATRLTGQVYAQPLVVTARGEKVLLVETEENNAYGLDPQTGAVLWSRNVGPSWPASAIGCGDLVPDVGITATPAFDPATGTEYFTAKVNDGPDVRHPHWYMHAVDVLTGAERPGFPTVIAGSPTNDKDDDFNAQTAMQRPALLLLGGVVYAGFASLCDRGPYVGYVAGVNAATGANTTLWSTESDSQSGEAGIWQSGGGLVSDGAGEILLATGNGVSPPPAPGSSPPSNLAESVVRLQVTANGSLKPVDFFSPVNNTQLDLDDADLGSGGPLAIPDGYGTASVPHLLVQVGKDGRLFLLDRDHLGGGGQGPSGTDHALQVLGPYNGVWGHPSFFGGGGGYVYTVEGYGYLRAYKVGASPAGSPLLAPVATSASTWGFSSGSPVVTSNGADPASALVWAVYSSGTTGSGGELRAYNAVPVGGVMQEVWSAPIGTATKFAVPATDDGRVYVATRDGLVYGFGQPSAVSLASAPIQLGSVPVGSSATTIANVTANLPVTITGVSTSSPFSIAAPTAECPLAFPISLAPGQAACVPVDFSPAVPGATSGALSFSTTTGTVAFSVTGTATQDGLGASPSSLQFGQVPVGGKVTLSVNVTNTSTSPETVAAATPPSSPAFSAPALPALVGSIIQPEASVTIPVTFAPTSSQGFADRFTLQWSAGAKEGTIVVALSGSSVAGAPSLTLTPSSINFGRVTIGRSVTRSFVVSNSGNLVLHVSKAAPPAGDFNTSSPLSEGQPLSPEQKIVQTVTFTPRTVGPTSATYVINGDDGLGPHQEVLTGTGEPAGTSGSTLPSSDGHWLAAADGGVFSFAGARYYGSTGNIHLNKPIVGIAPTPDGHGYWLVASDGGVFSFGDAHFYGSTGNIHLNKPVVGIAPTPDGHGYWLVASDGGVFSFGDARYYGSTGNIHLNKPVVGIAATPTGAVSAGKGYWLVASDGGVFTFGDARYYGSTGNIHLNKPIVGMAPTSAGDGYWLVASDGGVFSFAGAHYYGSVPGAGSRVDDVVGVSLLPDGGYVIAGGDGRGYWWSSGGGSGKESTGPLTKTVVGAAALPY